MDYAKYDYKNQRHHERYVRYVNSMPKKLTCQECGGAGGEVEPVLNYGEGPWMACGFCEGTGRMTPYVRGLWLKWKRQEKRKKQSVSRMYAPPTPLSRNC